MPSESFTPQTILEQIERLRKAVTELEDYANSVWRNASCHRAKTSGGRHLRSVAKRIVLEAQSLENRVTEHTFHR